jgi:hypothetical protein
MDKYPQVLSYPEQAFYVIDKAKSQTSKDEYRVFCEDLGIACRMKWPAPEILKRDAVNGSFSVQEPILDVAMLRRLMEREACEKGVRIVKGAEVVEGGRTSRGAYRILTREGRQRGRYLAMCVINATYAYSNNILRMFRLDAHMTRYRLQMTEIAVARTRRPIPPLTVMDGPFLTIMPYAGHANRVLVYDVVNSVVHEQEAYCYENSRRCASNWSKMVERGETYFPFMRDLEYESSLWGARPIPVTNDAQSRRTRIARYKSQPGFYSILEGKLSSALLIADQLKGMMRNEGYLM